MGWNRLCRPEFLHRITMRNPVLKRYWDCCRLWKGAWIRPHKGALKWRAPKNMMGNCLKLGTHWWQLQVISTILPLTTVLFQHRIFLWDMWLGRGSVSVCVVRRATFITFMWIGWTLRQTVWDNRTTKMGICCTMTIVIYLIFLSLQFYLRQQVKYSCRDCRV